MCNPHPSSSYRTSKAESKDSSAHPVRQRRPSAYLPHAPYTDHAPYLLSPCCSNRCCLC
ncbi:hypothetical protein BDV96DRAFT_561054 [Lophiotrema nucula]|uniref:Uncharacterized protein n=1 Tax=Lophiotrema nucula TaxID=690887 RepID=A0A6A5ZUE4_9PLEO|nr:hypothetical protein BDV96DRAFT_561054 [Lophiotrema nucula]